MAQHYWINSAKQNKNHGEAVRRTQTSSSCASQVLGQLELELELELSTTLASWMSLQQRNESCHDCRDCRVLSYGVW